MSPGIKYSLYLLLLHVALGASAYWLIDNKWMFIALQPPLLLSLVVGVRFFYLADKPYRQLMISIRNLEGQDWNSSIIATGHAEMDRFIGQYNRMIRDIREERYRLEGQGKFLAELIAISPIGVLITDFDGCITEANRSAEQYLGVPQDSLPGQPLSDLVPEQREIVHHGSRRLRITTNQVRYKGFYRQVVLLEDLTAELLKTEKEAYGKIIRMMSHEVNNASGALHSILCSLRDYLEEQQAGQEWTEIIQVAIERHQSLGQFVDNFASVLRVYPPNKQSVQLTELARRVVQVWSLKAREQGIALEFESPEEATQPVQIDPVQIEQVLHNAIKNATEALGSEGRIRVRVLDGGRTLQVEDNGCGLSPEAEQAVLNTPFYSTKSQGQGIGLMLTREIVALHDARFRLHTGEDGWTRFELGFG